MADPATVCEFCNAGVDAQFGAGGARDVEVITGDLLVQEQCFVRDEIRFVNQGRLIFVPGERKEYFREYFVICRKLVVTGGKPPGGGINPCGPDDPGDDYRSNNVITWLDRLNAAASGAPFQTAAAKGQDFDVNNWSSNNNPNGNNGAHGGTGTDGAKGNPGGSGRNSPDFTLVVLEIDIGSGDNLTIDFDGQNGGDGGRGQEGGKGGSGMGGRDGSSDTSWPGTGCERQPGNGGNGGDGGDGGVGGDAGDGGDAGKITLVSTPEYLASGPFFGGKLHYVNDGGSRGAPGPGGKGGKGNQSAGKPGKKTSECSEANDGNGGNDGSPDSMDAANANVGSPGANGSGASLSQEPLTAGTCLDRLPLPIQVGSVTPAELCRGFGTPATVDAALGGASLTQVVSVATSLAGVTATILPTSTDGQLDLRFDIAGNSATGQGDLTLTPGFGTAVTVNNAITVNRFEVTGVAPNNGNTGTQVAVTISGTCFDPAAAVQQINVSGVGITVLNPIVLDSTTVQCVFDIAGLAPSGARDVTVKTGALTHTLLGGFTVA